MKKLGLQVYTIRDVFANEGNEVAFKKIAEAGYTQAQTAGAYDSIDGARAYAAAAKAAGVEIVGTHYDWDKIRNNVEETVEIHRKDFLLGVIAFELHGNHPLNGLLHQAFPKDACLFGIELLGKLLGDGTTPTRILLH